MDEKVTLMKETALEKVNSMKEAALEKVNYVKNNSDIRIHSSNHGYANFNFSVILYDDCHDDKGSGLLRDHLVWPWIKVEEQHGRVSGFQCQPSIALPELMAKCLSKR